jgi:hypothetical protein
VPRNMADSKPPEDSVVIYDKSLDSEIPLELPLPGDLQPGTYQFKVLLEPVDKVERIGKKTALDLTVNVQKAPMGGGKPRPSFGNDTNKKAEAIKEAEKLKRLFPMPPPPPPAAGS